ncbi:hypothetical protein OJF2_30840 [Aquisphaera giovannonii]|uniref:DUF304 domain-containing protein n=1 Tax=Aquisphaera giovannonii TaxID=406548 RepID=A0A5B9W2N4_9BACT|nr:hypothetical protein [Aquisphaera giovannonii]QEH34544.1 hypothetical protein OJF2_30840 [Aquisphaera giovannonii]
MSTVATMRPAATVFHEEQYFDWRVYAFIALVELAAGVGMFWLTRQWGPVASLLSRKGSVEFVVGLIPTVAMPFLLVFGLLRMTTVVTPTELRVWFGWVPVYRRAVQVSGIVRHQVVEYRPIADYGGWGVRAGRDGERVLNARGNRGVRLELADGTRLLIGSQRPEELAETIEAARRPDVV